MLMASNRSFTLTPIVRLRTPEAVTRSSSTSFFSAANPLLS